MTLLLIVMGVVVGIALLVRWALRRETARLAQEREDLIARIDRLAIRVAPPARTAASEARHREERPVSFDALTEMVTVTPLPSYTWAPDPVSPADIVLPPEPPQYDGSSFTDTAFDGGASGGGGSSTEY